MSDDDMQLLEAYRHPLKDRYIEITRTNTRLLIILTIIITISVLIQLTVIGSVIYIYKHNITQIIPETRQALNRWDEVYTQMQPYLGRISELFNMIDEFEKLESEGNAAIPLIEAFISQINNFVQTSEQYMTWSEQCIQSQGICASAN